MTRITLVELHCDNCGQADHYKPGNVTIQARQKGWVISKLGDFCDNKCLSEFKRKQQEDNNNAG